jgi:hypothetical protein
MAQNLQVNYAAKHNAVLEKIARLQSAAEDMPSPDHPQLAWSDHGELCRLDRDLEEILEYLES